MTKQKTSQEKSKEDKVWEIHLCAVCDFPINEHKDMALAVYQDLYNKILKDDPQWHLFYEDQYDIVRFSYRFLNDVEECLQENHVRYWIKGEWTDDSVTVMENQDIYLGLFHSFSELAMRDISKDIANNLDRIIHCFLNHQFLTLDDCCAVWEERFVSNYLINRSFYTGRCCGVNQMKDWYKKQKEGEETE